MIEVSCMSWYALGSVWRYITNVKDLVWRNGNEGLKIQSEDDFISFDESKWKIENTASTQQHMTTSI
jgi:hypothetical protein